MRPWLLWPESLTNQGNNMIKWQSNFEIQDSALQLGTAWVTVDSYETVDGVTTVQVKIADDTGENIAKQYAKTYDRTFANLQEIYAELVKDFDPAEVI